MWRNNHNKTPSKFRESKILISFFSSSSFKIRKVNFDKTYPLKFSFLILIICSSFLDFKKSELTYPTFKSCASFTETTAFNYLLELKPVTYSDFEKFVSKTKYITDAEKYGWSIVQLDVYNFKTVKNANWRVPNGKDSVINKNLPVTQVSYNDAIAYCKWKKKRLPTYKEYWKIALNDNRFINSNNKMPISDISKVNIIGNVWDITESKKGKNIRLAGGSIFCSENTCNGTVKDRELYVDKETGNIHIGFSVIN